MKFSQFTLHRAMDYHTESNTPLYENVFRPHSDMNYALFRHARSLYESGDYECHDWFEQELIESDIGELDVFEGVKVPLDFPLQEEDDKELNSPKRGGNKKYYVYVKNEKGNVIKVEFGDTTGLTAKINDLEARKSFAARHDCANKTDKTKPGYWACRLPYWGKSLGLSTSGKFFW
jgi:hypothetical protein